MQLVKANIEFRVAHPAGLHKSTTSAMQMMGYDVITCSDPARNPVQLSRLLQAKRCKKCPRNSDRKTKLACKVCAAPVCKDDRQEEVVCRCLDCTSDTE